MPAARIGRGRAAAVAVAVTAALSLVTLQVAQATSPSEETMHSWVNEARSDHSVRRLDLNERISRMARNHSERMAERGYVYHHECLECRFDNWDWRKLGENVAVGDSMRDVFRDLMDSSGHRANILDPDFWQEGVGIVKERGQVWVTMMFYG